MSYLKGAFIFPHPPIIISEVGRGQENAAKSTIRAAEEAAKRIAEYEPETIIVITPHGNMFRDAITVNRNEQIGGNFSNFGAPQVKLELTNDIELSDEILRMAEVDDVMSIGLDSELRRTYGYENELDHGALVPLYFVSKQYKAFKLVHINYSLLPNTEHYRFGIAVRKAIENLGRNTIVICSGDLSHRLTKEAPAGFRPKGAEFDAKYVELIERGDAYGILDMNCELSEGAGECGLRSTVVMFGVLDGCSPHGEILSYEGPFGVGYCVAELHLSCKEQYTETKSDILEAYINAKRAKMQELRSKEDPYVALARHALESFIISSSVSDTSALISEEMLKQKAGTFVSIKKHGELRGCIGTIAPTTANVAEEIIQNAISAGTQDPRFHPIEEEELEELQYSVDILLQPELIENMSQLDPQRYGVIVRSGYKSGLLLPKLEGVDTIEEQLDIALQKAGIAKNEAYEMQRFEVIRHS